MTTTEAGMTHRQRDDAGTRDGITSAGAPIRIGEVALVVRDLDLVSRFYQRVIGLRPVETGSGLARLGVGDTTLLELRHEPSALLAGRGEAGLFHTAFLLPSRVDLAEWLRAASGEGVRLQGASDHLVSEALYLADPEGNGIEIYRDRPSGEWPWEGEGVRMATLPLDLPALVRTARPGSWPGLPEGSLVAHVHLQVGELEPAERFYAGVLGLDVTCRYPGATFFGAGGYHHHLAGNIWNSRGASRRRPGSTGLASVELVPARRDVADAIAERARSAGFGISILADPWGTEMRVRTV